MSNQRKKTRTVTLDVDLNAELSGFASAREVTPAHRRVMKHYASPLILGPPQTETLLELMLHMFTEDEADLVQHLPPLRSRTAAKVSKLSGRPLEDVTRVLDHLANTKSVILALGNPRKYSLLPLVPGTFEMTLMTPDLSTRNLWHKKFAQLFESIFESGYFRDYQASVRPPLLRFIPVGQVGKSLQMAWPSERIEELIEPYQTFAVGNCQCRISMQLNGKGCDAPLENCVGMGPIAEGVIARGLMRRAEKQEIIDIKRQAEEYGLVSWFGADSDFLGNGGCSCCACCCAGLRMLKTFNAPGLFCKPHFMPVSTPDTCTLCRKCVRVCPTEAWQIEEKKLNFNAARCIGCGLCVVTCESGTLTLQPVEKVRPPPSDTTMTGFLLRAMPSYITNSIKVWVSRQF